MNASRFQSCFLAALSGAAAAPSLRSPDDVVDFAEACARRGAQVLDAAFAAEKAVRDAAARPPARPAGPPAIVRPVAGERRTG